MKTKIKITNSFILPNYSLIIALLIYYKYFGGLFIAVDILVGIIISVLIIYNLHPFFGIPLVIKDGVLHKNFYFITHKIEINENTTIQHGTWLNLKYTFNKLVICTNDKKIVIYDIYTNSLISIENFIIDYIKNN